MNQETNPVQDQAKPGLSSLLQSISRKLRNRLTRTWMRVLAPFSAISPLFTYLAGLPLAPYKGKRKLLSFMGDRAYVSPKAQINCPELTMGPKCFIDDYVTMYAHEGALGGVYLDRNVHIYRWSVIELGRGQASLRVGSNTYIQSGCNLNPFVGNITIGANCMIAPRCAFMPYGHSIGDIQRPMREQGLISRGDIVIEDDVWLGVGVCVTDGVTIGKGAVIGAGAVVKKDIPPYAIAGGVPARVIRFREGATPHSVAKINA